MGGKSSKAAVVAAAPPPPPRATVLSPAELASFTAAGCPFKEEELQALFTQFCSMKSSPLGQEMPTVTLAEFQSALGFSSRRSSTFVERVFRLMDGNKDNSLTFHEFVESVEIFNTPNSTERKMRFTFSLYDATGKGYISPADLKALLRGVLADNGITLTEAQMDHMVAETFRQHDSNADGVIDYAEYAEMCSLNPSVLKPLCLVLADLVATTSSAGKAPPQPAAPVAPAAGKRR